MAISVTKDAYTIHDGEWGFLSTRIRPELSQEPTEYFSIQADARGTFAGKYDRRLNSRRIVRNMPDAAQRHEFLLKKLVTFARLNDHQWDELDSDPLSKVAIARGAVFLQVLFSGHHRHKIDPLCASKIELASTRSGGLTIVIPFPWHEFEVSIEPDGESRLLIIDFRTEDDEARYFEFGEIEPADLPGTIYSRAVNL